MQISGDLLQKMGVDEAAFTSHDVNRDTYIAPSIGPPRRRAHRLFRRASQQNARRLNAEGLKLWRRGIVFQITHADKRPAGVSWKEQ